MRCNLRLSSWLNFCSEYLITSRETYNELVTKPPLQPAFQSEIGAIDSVFSFDGVIHLNLKLLLVYDNEYVVEYKPVLVHGTITCRLGHSKLDITLKCYKEKLNPTSQYVQVLKSNIINNGGNIKVIYIMVEIWRSWAKLKILNASIQG